MDREMVIKELRGAIRYLEDKEWSDEDAGQHVEALIDALELLKNEKIIHTEHALYTVYEGHNGEQNV